MTQITFETDDSGYEVNLVLKTKKVGSPLDEKAIVGAFEASEYSLYFFMQENLKNALAELGEVLKPLTSGQTGRDINYKIAQKKDAVVSISTDPESMAAYAEIESAYGGKHATAKDILNASQKHSISKGFSKQKLLDLAQKASRLRPGEKIKEQIARGKPPVRGKDAKIRHMVENAQDRILKPKEREDGTVDMKDLGDILCVKAGDVLAQKIPATDGHTGYTVTGTVLEPEPGEDFELCAGNGVKVSDNDNNYLISEIIGMPRLIDNGVMVDQVFQVNNVDVGSGHINFEGSVIIAGNINEGMKVIASGDITVGGFVESAIVQAGGDVTIKQGIIGKQFDPEAETTAEHKMSALISAGGNIFAKYAQYAELNATDVIIENQMMHCLLNLSGNVWVGRQDKANGKLIGGYINGGEGVYAGTIGAPAGTNTTIKFESKLLALKQNQSEINARIETSKAKTDELQKTINQIKKLPKSDKTKELLTKATKTFQHHSAILGDILVELEQAEEEYTQAQHALKVEATEKLYHGVEVFIGDFTDRSRREYGPSRLIYDKRKVIIDPIVNN